MKILAQSKHAPGAIRFKTNPEIIGHEFPVLAFQFVARRAVNHVHAEVLAPVVAPFGLVEALHHENEFLDVLRNGSKPFVVFGRVLARAGGKQFNHGAE